MAYQDILDQYQKELDCPGILMGVEAGPAAWYGGAGCFSIKDVDKSFYVYSLTKTYTSACILKLVESGYLDLDDPLRLHMPSLNMPEDVTIRRLLNHTGGIPDYAGLPEYAESLRTDPAKPLTRDKILEITQARGLAFKPGARFMYSNTGYVYLYALVEMLTGHPYAETIQRFIAEPLGLEMTRVATGLDKSLTLLPGYAGDPPFNGRDVRPLYHPDWVATGLMVSTVGEVIRFYKALFSGGLLGQDTLKEMTRSVEVDIPSPPFISPRYGLGLNHDPDYPLGETYGHGGGGPGYGVYAGYMPDLKGQAVTFCAMCNASPAGPPPWLLWHRVMEQIAKG